MSEEKPKMPLKGLALYVALGVVAALTSVGVYAGVQYLYQVADSKKGEVQAPLDNPASAETRSETSNHDAGTTALKKTSESFRSVAKKVGPAVVNIKATRGVKKPKMARPRNRRPAPGPGPGPDDEESPFPRDPF